jgi:hypothetical protein
MLDYTILQTTGDTNIIFDLSNNFSRVDKGDDIKKFIEKEVETKINPAYDSEVIMLKYGLSNNYKLQLELYNKTTSTYQKDFTILFSEQELKQYKPVFFNSIIIYEFFDEINSDKNIRAGISYLFNYRSGRYSDDTNNQFYFGSTVFDVNFDYQKNIIINKSIFNKQDYIYLKMSYFNSKTGKLIRFYNPYKQSINTEEKLYYKLLLNKNNYTYQFDISELNGFLTSNYLLPFKELITGTPEIDNSTPIPASSLSPGGLNNGGNGNSNLNNKGVIIC